MLHKSKTNNVTVPLLHETYNAKFTLENKQNPQLKADNRVKNAKNARK